MKKKIIFHIGFPKTGTTSLQMFMASRQEALSNAGILFPAVPGRFGPGTGAAGSGQGPHADMAEHFFRIKAKRRPSSGIDWRMVFDTFRNDDRHKTMIISQESQSVMSNKIRPKLYREASRNTETIFLAYLREPVSWLNSLYMQSTAALHTRPKLPEQHRGLQRYLQEGYEGILRPYAELGQLELRSFDALRERNALIPDFLETIGAAGLAEEGNAATRRNVKRLSAEHIVVLRSVKEIGCDIEDFQKIRKACARAGETKGNKSVGGMLLPVKLRKKIQAVWTKEKPRLAERYGLEMPPSPPPQDTPEIQRISPQFAEEMYERVGSHLNKKGHAIFAQAILKAQEG